MAGYHGPGPDPTLVIRPKQPSPAPVIVLLLLMAGAGVGGFFLMTREQHAARSGCVDTVYDLPATSASTPSTFQCTPQQAVQVSVAPDGHRIIACRCRGRDE